MANQLIKIAITPEVITSIEPQIIVETLDRGWDMFHLRHPSASFRDMRNLIEAIPQRYHCRLRLHGHFELLNSFNLGGINLNRRCPDIPANYKGPHSRSCHSIEEIKNCGDCDYVTLSPVFDSISKAGYLSAFDEETLSKIDKTASNGVNVKVIALGGVSASTIQEVKRMDFDGIAVLGALTEAKTVEEFRRNLDTLETALDK